ncbi:hypothetical protein NC796_09055 [Aliifodinibius sp. S!AR15-10]|uniref:hypothetical protein n=1 Tax=Aliifodinibius sp. S!AR15-10 TaxID=2950437 RepID=UPI00285678EF|nr:hypothetical protein [Aliifodinibius sp. S!AR15-10]MDR8391283.1 hypothetical protein [Aliifodinibius sp. S!AR15-10]
MFEHLLIINIAATLFMTGLIWFVQVVHYPGFSRVGEQDFREYHGFHVLRTGIVVIPPMIIELATSIWLVVAFDRLWMFNVFGLALVIGIWLSTGLLQAPTHGRLQSDSSSSIISKLVATNWIRTVLWSVKAALGIYLLMKVI